MSGYKEIFEGVGKLKDYQVKLHGVTSQAHPIFSSTSQRISLFKRRTLKKMTEDYSDFWKG